MKVRTPVNFILVMALLLAPGLLAAPPFYGGRLDSTQIKLLNFGKDRIEVRLVDGTELHGRATVTDSGLVLHVPNYEKSLTPSTHNQDIFLPWRKIDRLDFDRKGIRYPGVVFFGALFFGLFILGIFMSKY